MTTCDAVEQSCRCERSAEHKGPHVCDCGGSWIYDDEGMRPLTYPGGFLTAGEALAAIVRNEAR